MRIDRPEILELQLRGEYYHVEIDEETGEVLTISFLRHQMEKLHEVSEKELKKVIVIKQPEGD